MVQISSNPEGAAINIDGYSCGRTPQAFFLQRNVAHHINVTKEGHHPESFLLKSHVSPMVASNILPPLAIGGIAAGAAALYDPMLMIVVAPIGLVVCAVMILSGIGIDFASGSAHSLDASNINAQLTPY